MKALILVYVEVDYESSTQDDQVMEYANELTSHMKMGYPVAPAGISVQRIGLIALLGTK